MVCSKPDQTPTEHPWKKKENQLQVRSIHLTSVPDLTNALLAKWAKIPTDRLQHHTESLLRKVEAVRLH